MKVRAKDIAEKLNISPATVSLVLNNKPGIREETRQLVLRTIKEMGYKPALFVKQGGGFYKSIRFIVYKKHGMVVSDTPFFSALMEGIEQEARDAGYNLAVSYINEKDNISELLRNISESNQDGSILLATEMRQEDLKAFRCLQIPLIILDNYFSEVKLDTIVIGNREGTYEAVQYLINNGHREIGYLQSVHRISNFEERKEGLLKALEDNGAKLDKKYIFGLEPTLDGAYRDMQAALQEKPLLPSAFFADNDIIACGVVKAFKEYGYRIPEDISVIGFDDMPFCEMIEPPLTTVRVFKQKMGIMAVRRLLEKIREEDEGIIKVEVRTELVERKSVRKKGQIQD